MRIRHLLAGFTLTLMVFSAHAQARQFPANAKHGVASFTTYPKIIIEEVAYLPAPGLRIWNTNGMIVFRRSVSNDKLDIRYTVDSYKLIDRIWILTPEEIKNLPPSKNLVTVNGSIS